jgi:DNA-directed RNA polymerase subunit RPC12/RpoP
LPSEEQYKGIMSGYDKETDTMACRNCGGQTMYGKPLGYTAIDPETGLGCKHEYVGRDAGRCYTIYTCRKCGSRYDIDSGD